MKTYLEEYGLIITITIIVLLLMGATATFGTAIKNGVNDKIKTAVAESGIQQHVIGEDSGTTVTINLEDAIGVLPIENGGTGATTVEDARKNLELGAVAIEEIVPIAKGGTGATTAAQARRNLGTMTKSELINERYPVGAVYMSTKSTNPSTLFGGTWTQIKDRFLLAAGDEYSAGTTGGSANAINVSHTHTASLTTGSAGSHSHYYFGNTGGSENWGARIMRNKIASAGTMSTLSDGAHTHSISGTAQEVGSSGAGKNMPPYLTVYMWRRTS